MRLVRKNARLAALCFGLASSYGWATLALPHRSGGGLQITTGLLAALHLGWATAALARGEWAIRRFVWLVRATLAGSAFLVLGIARSAVELALHWSRLGTTLVWLLAAIALAVLQVGLVPWLFWRTYLVDRATR